MFKIWVFWSNILPCVARGLMTEVMIGQKKVHNGSTEPAGLRSSVSGSMFEKAVQCISFFTS